VDLDAIARELYGADRDAFTAARDARVRALKAAGETQLARQVAALRRPTVAAAVVNLLAGAQPERIAALLHIGDEMRQAPDAGALRRLVEQQRGEVAALVRLARGVAREHGLTVSESTAAAVEGTLRAAVADPDVGAQVSAGVLAKEQQPSGFPLTPPAAAAPPAASGDDSMDAAAGDGPDATQAAAALATAQAVLDDAEQLRGQAVQEAVAAAARRDVVAEELARLRAQVGEAEQRAEQAERDLDEARLREAHATEQARRAADDVARVRRAGPRPPGRRSTP
jgi:hypothetical protein